MNELVIASNNSHKIEEIKSILGKKFQKIYSLKEKNIEIEIIEDGNSFEANALIKAREICSLTGLVSLADDSGLCVDALGGAPGIFSARYAGSHCNDESNNRLLLSNMCNVKNRKAHYTAVVALVYPDGREIVAEGKTHGTILDGYRGTGGFGYDPLFLSDELGATFAECNAQEKNSVSHRAKALEKLLTLI